MRSAVYLRALIALIITISAAYYQRLTGPTHPLNVKLEWYGTEISGELTRNHSEPGNQPIQITVPDTSISAILVYRRFNSGDKWIGMKMIRENDELYGSLPHQPPAGKLEYFIQLQKGNDFKVLPQNLLVATRFTGEVPTVILGSHIIFMFFAMFLSNWAGIEAISKKQLMYNLTLWTAGVLFIGGMILGPVVQKFAFGEYWTGVPFGIDLTDNKTLISMVLWIVAAWLSYRRKASARVWIIVAAIVMLIIFSIPHSMMGSELNYKTGKIGTGKLN